MLEEALSYPTSGDRGIGRILIGGVLTFFWFLIIPVLLIYGYVVRSMGAAATGQEEPVEFEDWGGMLVDGLKALIISIAYGIIPFAIAVFFTTIATAGGAAAGNSNAAGVFAGLGLLGAVLNFLASLVVSYVLWAALTNFAVEGNIGAAFDFTTIKQVITSDAYILAFVLFIGIYIALALIAVLVGIVTFGLAFILYIIIGPFFAFWFYLVIAYLFGSAYHDVMGESAA